MNIAVGEANRVPHAASRDFRLELLKDPWRGRWSRLVLKRRCNDSVSRGISRFTPRGLTFTSINVSTIPYLRGSDDITGYEASIARTGRVARFNGGALIAFRFLNIAEAVPQGPDIANAVIGPVRRAQG